MVLQYEVDGKTTVHRNVAWNKRTEYIEGFLALRHYHRNGRLYQLIGREKRLLRVFGTVTINKD